jgi:hypothetical protein
MSGRHMTVIKSIVMENEQFVVDFDDVVWGQPETVVINKASRTIRIVYKRKERGQQKVEGCNFDDIVSFRVELVGGGDSGSYFMIFLETTIGKHFKLVPVSGTTFGLVKEHVVRDLFTKMNTYLPETRQLPLMSKRLVTYPETSGGFSIARINNTTNKVAFTLFFAFIGIAFFAVVGGFSIVSIWMTIEGHIVTVLSIPFIFLAIIITEKKSIIIDPGNKQLVIERCWCWCILRQRKHVSFSDIAGFEPFIIGQKCHVRMLRAGSLPPINLYVTSYDSAEARGLVDWLKEHVPTGDAK